MVVWVLGLALVLGVGGPLYFYLIGSEDFSDRQAGPPPAEMAAAADRCADHGGIMQGAFDVGTVEGNWSGWGDVVLEGKQGRYSDTATNAHWGKLTLFAHADRGYYLAFFHEVARFPVGQQPPVDQRPQQAGILYFHLCADGQAIEGAARASDRSLRFPGQIVPLSWQRL